MPQFHQSEVRKSRNNELKKKPQVIPVESINAFHVLSDDAPANAPQKLSPALHATKAMTLGGKNSREKTKDGQVKAVTKQYAKKDVISTKHSSTQGGLKEEEGDDRRGAPTQPQHCLNSKQRQNLEKIAWKYQHLDSAAIKEIFVSKSCNFKETLDALEKQEGKPAQVTTGGWTLVEKKAENNQKAMSQCRLEISSRGDLDVDFMIVKNGGEPGMVEEFKTKMGDIHNKKKTKAADYTSDFERLYADFARYLDDNVVYMRHLPTRIAMKNFKFFEAKALRSGHLPVTLTVYPGSGNDSPEKKRQQENSTNKKTLAEYLKMKGYESRKLNRGCLAVFIA